ncbi:MAG: type II secretion system F family protein [PVC group bacterium]|nr:type II secretion system F family protein [PVC group bacterium]
MAIFKYTAKDSSGKIYQGALEARDEQVLRSRLKESGFYVTSLKKKMGFSFDPKEPKVKLDDLVSFGQQFAGMLGAGLPIIRCLRALEKQSENLGLKRISRDLRLDIEGGAALSEALAKHPQVFSDFFVSLIQAGEKAGMMDKVWDRLAAYLEKQQDLIRKVKGAFAYPVIVGIIAFCVMTFLVLVIVPIFKDVYDRINVPLPGPTVALIALSNFSRKFWWVILLAGAGVGILFRKIKKISKIRKGLDHFKINMPIFGTLIRKASIARFIRTFADMLDSGVGILESIDVAGKVAGNKAVLELVDKMRDSVRQGGNLSDSLQKQTIFPASAVQMISAGEESGNLPYMLQKSADTLERDVDIAVKRLMIKIEPLLTMLLAILIGFIAMAIYLPMFDLIKQINA